MSSVAITLIDMMLRESTNPHEADNAKRRLTTLVDRAGGAANLLGNASAAHRFAPAPPPISFTESRRRINSLESEVSGLQGEIRGLIQRNGKLLADLEEARKNLDLARGAIRLKTKVEKPKVEKPSAENPKETEENNSDPVASRTIAFSDFSEHAKKRLGGKWRQYFREEITNGDRLLRQASAEGKAPADWLNILFGMKLDDKNLRVGDFTTSEVEMLRRLYGAGGDDAYMAERATEKFGRPISPGSIRRLRSDLKNGNRQYGEPEYGGEFHQKHHKTRWTKNDPTSVRIAEMFVSGMKTTAIIPELAKAGIHLSEGQIKGKIYNVPPPRAVISAIRYGPMALDEVWFIFASVDDKKWYKNAKAFFGLNDLTPDTIKDIGTDKIDAARRLYSK